MMLSSAFSNIGARRWVGTTQEIRGFIRSVVGARLRASVNRPPWRFDYGAVQALPGYALPKDRASVRYRRSERWLRTLVATWRQRQGQRGTTAQGSASGGSKPLLAQRRRPIRPPLSLSWRLGPVGTLHSFRVSR